MRLLGEVALVVALYYVAKWALLLLAFFVAARLVTETRK